MKSYSWNKVKGSICIELCFDMGRLFDIDGDQLTELQDHFADDGELVIEFLSSGHYAPQTRDDPAEQSDERELDSAYVMSQQQRFSLPPAIQEALFERYRDLVYAAEFRLPCREDD